jgi:hypothetical protein
MIGENESWKIDFTGLTWWNSCPEVGTPECKCSLCLEPFSEDDVPIMFFKEKGDLVVRLHDACFMKRAELKSQIKEIKQS